MPAPRRLVVNADDFGYSRSVNRGIVESHTRGIVTRTSIMATGSGFEDAVERALATPSLPVGVHLNFYRGATVLPPERVPSLVGSDGLLLGSWREIVRRLASGQLDLSQLEAELGAQIDRVTAAGLEPLHLDSDKHLHLWPSAFDVTCRLALKHGIRQVRVVREPVTGQMVPLGLHALSARNSRVAESMGLSVAHSTIGVTAQPVDTASLARLLRGARGQSVEFVVHPGHIDDEFMELQRTMPNRLVATREAELATLCGESARRLVREAGFTLVAEV